jgi:K+-sensing histidine kinase KdpD
MTQQIGTPAAAAPRTSVVVGFALLAPPLVAGALHLLGEAVTPAVGALVLVLVVVAAAASGIRIAGVLAAVSAGVLFDFFLTAPRLSLTIVDRDDVEVMVLLLLVGLAVTEIALWGRRQQARASRQAGYLAGVLRTADLVALHDASPQALTDEVAARITDVLGVDGCRFEPTDGRHAASATALHRDGSVTQRDVRIDVDRHGLPTDDLLALPVEHDGVPLGRFLVTSSTRHARPTVEQRRVAVTLADQVGTRLAARVG